MTDDDDAEIRAGIARDPDAFEITDEMWARARQAREVMPEIVKAYRRSRGLQKAPTKQLVSMRLDRDVIAHFRERGAGWQRSINDTLRRAARLGPRPGPKRPGAKKASSITKSPSPARRRPRRGR
jgi:uncharacterized protein (DUF4415 family)